MNAAAGFFRLQTQDVMAVFAHRSWNIFERFAVIQTNFSYRAARHFLNQYLSLDESHRTYVTCYV